MNLRKKAINDLVIRHREMMGYSFDEEAFLNMVKRLSDPNLFAFYIEIFGRPVQGTAEVMS